VPRRSSTGKCRACLRPLIFLKTVKGNWMPCNAETVKEGEEIFLPAKGHISHFSDCPKAKEFRKG